MSRKSIRSICKERWLTDDQIDTFLKKIEPRFHAIINQKFPMGQLFSSSDAREDLLQQCRELTIKALFGHKKPFSVEKSIELYHSYRNNTDLDVPKEVAKARKKALSVSLEEWIELGMAQYATTKIKNHFRRLAWENSDKARGASTVYYDEIVTGSARYAEQHRSNTHTETDLLIESLANSEQDSVEVESNCEKLLEVIDRTKTPEEQTEAVRNALQSLAPAEQSRLIDYLESRTRQEERESRPVYEEEKKNRSEELAPIVVEVEAE